jgi:tetratricopeptide (TPR) repeat protein/transcriptional regulator with XRE-family HTH domain
MNPAPHATPFAQLLRGARREAGLTQEALAEQSGVAWRTISDLERGVKLPRRDTMALLAEALALTVDQRTAFEAAARRHVFVPTEAPALAVAQVDAGSPGLGGPVPLVGRAQELALLERHLAGAGPPLLLLAGEPGIGKSRLLQETAWRAHTAGWSVLAGGCSRSGGEQPFTPLLEALERHLGGQTREQVGAALDGCDWLLRLLPELPVDPSGMLPGWTVPPEQERRLMFKAVRRLLANVAGPAGTLLVLDDLQWAGADALELLASLLRQKLDAPLRIVGAYRDTEVRTEQRLASLLAELAEAQLASQWAVRPLGQEEAEELLGHLLGGRAQAGSALVAQVLQRAGGVPFFLVSYVRAMEGAGGGTASQGVPWDLQQSIRRRVRALPEPGRDLLAVAAVVGPVVSCALLLALLAEPERTVLNELEGVCRAGLLEEVGEDSYRFVHDVIREAVEADLGLARRRALHRQVAEALQRQVGVQPIVALAYHFRQAGDHTKAAIYLEQAGDLASANLAHAAAVELYQGLVTCLERMGGDIELLRAREKLAGALERTAQYDAALTVLEQVVSSFHAAHDMAGLARVEIWIARLYFEKGAFVAAIARLQPLVAGLEASGPSSALSEAYQLLATNFGSSGQAERGSTAALRAVESARVVGERTRLARALFSRAFTLLLLSHADEALQACEEAARVWGEDWAILHMLAWIYEERGEYEQGKQVAARCLALAEQARDPSGIIFSMSRLGLSAFLGGDWSSARAYLERGMALSQQVGYSEGLAYALPRCDLGRLLQAEGAWDQATNHFEAVLMSLAGTGGHSLTLVAHGHRAECEVFAGHPAAACARLMPLLDSLEERMVTQYIRPVLAWAQYELGDLDRAAATAREATRRARSGTCRLGLVQALRVQAQALLARERWDEAEQSLAEGLAVARGMPYPHGEGRLLQVYGQLQVRRREPQAACERLEAALRIFRRLGARVDAERAEQLLAALK